jgi:hypothetical protein
MASLRLLCGLALAVCGMMSTAARASIIVPLSTLNDGSHLPGSAPYGTITLDAVTVGSVQAVQFTVTSMEAGYFIDKLDFNSTLSSNTLRLENTSITGKAPILNGTAANFNVSEFGRFEFEFDTKHPSDFSLTSYTFTVVATSGGKDVSCMPEDFLALSSGNAFAGHIKADNNSAFISGNGIGTPPTPEPASLSVVGIGAALLLRRRKVHAA